VVLVVIGFGVAVKELAAGVGFVPKVSFKVFVAGYDICAPSGICVHKAF